jgi:hypothetical protein
MKCGRNSIGVEIEPKYARMTAKRLQQESGDMFTAGNIEFLSVQKKTTEGTVCVREETALYTPRKKKSKRKSVVDPSGTE